jgi:hypothetical protein
MIRAIATAGLSVAVLASVGCGCGGAYLGPGAGDGGLVTFEVPPGQAQTLQIPVETNDASETFTSASVMGLGAQAFQVLTPFPITATAGTPAMVEVKFAPEQAGTFSASLVLDTASMGDSTISIQGTAAAGDAG